MAEFLDERPDEELQDGEELATLEEEDTTNQEPQEETPEEVETEEDDDLPEKYKGKSAKDIIRMHQEAEKLLGRQSSEVGELRKLVDNFIQTQTQQATQPNEPEEEIDFFENPQKAVEQMLNNHPKFKQTDEMSRQLKQQQTMAQLQTNHPDFQDIVADNSFAEWVMASKVRQKLYAQADSEFDYDAADELLSTWKERKSIVKQTKEHEEQARKQQVKAASTGTAKGSGETPRKKIYRRADIIKLMQNDPQRYLDLADEITLAYSEGRVK
jgi:hypothetical protein